MPGTFTNYIDRGRKSRKLLSISNGVEKTAREVSEKMRNQFAAIIRTSGERCAETIRTQVQTHRNLASDVQQLIVALRNARIQRKSSPERLSPPRT